MVGRWIGQFPRARFVHENIATAPPVRGELTSHPLPALIVGLLTVLIMQPSLGSGVAASKTPKPNVARARSIGAHMGFGVVLYCSAWLWALLIRS
jgi:Protein of unknown function (DUF2938)